MYVIFKEDGIAFDRWANFKFSVDAVEIEDPQSEYSVWNGKDWVLDYEKQLESEKNKMYKDLDILQNKLIKNESYSYEDNYQSTKSSIILEIKSIRQELKK